MANPDVVPVLELDGIGLPALVRYVRERMAAVRAEGGIYDNGFVCIDEAGRAFEVDAEAFAALELPAGEGERRCEATLFTGIGSFRCTLPHGHGKGDLSAGRCLYRFEVKP